MSGNEISKLEAIISKLEATTSDIRDRVVRMETTINHMSNMRQEDLAQHNKDNEGLHARIKKVENRLFTIGWGLFITAITVIISLIKTIWSGSQ
jgi:hypothetical protein